MIITDWTFLKQEIKITQDLLTFHPPQDKRVPVMPFYTFLVLVYVPSIHPSQLSLHTCYRPTPFDQYRRDIYYICWHFIILQACPLQCVRTPGRRETKDNICSDTVAVFSLTIWFRYLLYAGRNKNNIILFSDRRETIMAVGYENIIQSPRNYLASDDF